MVRPDHVPVYVAAMGPQNLRLTGEMADGWLGNAFIPEAAEVFLNPLREGAEQAGRTLDQLDLVAPVAVEFHDDQAAADAAARRHADGYAFTIGAMGAGGKNFYNDAFTRLGYGTEVDTVAGLWQAGKYDEARSAVPLDLGRLTNLLGTPDTIADRVKRYRAAGITTLLAKLDGDPEQQLVTLQRLVAIADAA
jgi:alkanesulfonate monooxygenase SsuD/methylene tetrahydromethanopterin reductase-like flavin-dependent oxidoreductase (luciferase family)